MWQKVNFCYEKVSRNLGTSGFEMCGIVYKIVLYLPESDELYNTFDGMFFKNPPPMVAKLPTLPILIPILPFLFYRLT